MLLPLHVDDGQEIFALVIPVSWVNTGRTDLPDSGGDMDLLIRMIKERLWILDDDIAHPGKGPLTTIGREKATNPL